MEDKFGYLLKEEFEEDFINHVRDALKEKPNVTIQQLHDQVVRTWGGKGENDKTEYKIRHD